MKITAFQQAILGTIAMSQIIVASALVLTYLVMLQCKSSDGLTNLTMLVPWYVYALAYSVMSFMAFYFELVGCKNLERKNPET